MCNSKWEFIKSAISKKYGASIGCISYNSESGMVRVNGKGFAIYDEPKDELYRFGAMVRLDLP